MKAHVITAFRGNNNFFTIYLFISIAQLLLIVLNLIELNYKTLLIHMIRL